MVTLRREKDSEVHDSWSCFVPQECSVAARNACLFSYEAMVCGDDLVVEHGRHGFEAREVDREGDLLVEQAFAGPGTVTAAQGGAGLLRKVTRVRCDGGYSVGRQLD